MFTRTQAGTKRQPVMIKAPWNNFSTNGTLFLGRPEITFVLLATTILLEAWARRPTEFLMANIFSSGNQAPVMAAVAEFFFFFFNLVLDALEFHRHHLFRSLCTNV